MDIYKLKWTKLQHEIFRVMCVKSGQTLNLREIARLLKVSPTAVSKSMAYLKKDKLITVQKSKSINLLSIELNRDNKKVIEMKRIENLKIVYDSGLIDSLYNEFPGSTIFIFGSYSRGEDVSFGIDDEKSSDIDIAVIGTKGKDIDLKKFNMILERKVSINYYVSFNEIHKHLKNSILSGILISGSVEL
jgi:predicted nucleotidyltransferase